MDNIRAFNNLSRIPSIRNALVVLLMAFAMSQPVFAGSHLFHPVQSEAVETHTHGYSENIESHSHEHYQASHIDLTLNYTNASSITYQSIGALMLPKSTFHRYQITSAPDNPPPIFA